MRNTLTIDLDISEITVLRLERRLMSVARIMLAYASHDRHFKQRVDKGIWPAVVSKASRNDNSDRVERAMLIVPILRVYRRNVLNNINTDLKSMQAVPVQNHVYHPQKSLKYWGHGSNNFWGNSLIT